MRGPAQIEILRTGSSAQLDPDYVSTPEPIEYPSADGRTAHAFFYAPRNPDFVGPEGELPPLLTFTHGGPTGATAGVFSLAIQYWTTRGFAVIDVNYGGSTGYGTAYRRRLHGNWGIVDVEDCCAGRSISSSAATSTGSGSRFGAAARAATRRSAR